MMAAAPGLAAAVPPVAPDDTDTCWLGVVVGLLVTCATAVVAACDRS